MNRSYILSLQPGRYMDELVAKYVMELEGVGWYHRPNLGDWEESPYEGFGHLNFFAFPGHDYKGHFFHSVPLYSTDISAAWKIVTKLSGINGCDISRRDSELYIGYAEVINWSCHFGNGCEAFATTVPSAICRAALLTLRKHN